MARIIFNDVQSKLRDEFKRAFTLTYGMSYDAADGQFFLCCVKNKCKDAYVNNVIRNGDSTKFDSTTLFYCLLHSGALLLPKKRNNSSRVPPLNKSELIDQLREHRNKLAHSCNAEVDQQDFNTRVNDLNTIYQQLGWSCTDLQQAANGPINTAECFRLQQELLKEAANNNALSTGLRSLGQQLQTVEGMSSQVFLNTSDLHIVIDN